MAQNQFRQRLENLTREDRLKEAVLRLLIFSGRHRKVHPAETKIRDSINRLDGRIAAYSDETYPAPVRPESVTFRDGKIVSWTPRNDGWVGC